MNNPIKRPAWKETWFWLVMAPLLLVLVVSIGTVTLAFRVADDRVPDDYYKEGRMINKHFADEQNALAQGVSGRVDFDFAAAVVRIELAAQFLPGELHLTISHPIDASRDTHLVLQRTGEREYRADLPQGLDGRWYLLVRAAENAAQKGWRVTTEVDFQKSHSAAFAAHL